MSTPSNKLKPSVVIAALMVIASATAYALTPRHALSERWGRLDLETSIPAKFGEWVEEKHTSGGVINPQQQEVIDAIYSDTLSRTYVNARGDRVMLSVAYGTDQRDGLQVHKPEVCYPAQGFAVRRITRDEVQMQSRIIPVKRVETSIGARRIEPVTYWMTVGDEVVLGGLDKKLAEMRYSLDGVYPDGLLFRVSTIDHDSKRAYSIQDSFLRDVVAALNPDIRSRFAGPERR